jgi:hypothetical protein
VGREQRKTQMVTTTSTPTPSPAAADSARWATISAAGGAVTQQETTIAVTIDNGAGARRTKLVIARYMRDACQEFIAFV